MIIIMKPNASEEAVKKVTDLIESKGLTPHLSQGSQVTIVGVVGDKSRLAGSNIEISEGVDKVVSVTESYKLSTKSSILTILWSRWEIPISAPETLPLWPAPAPSSPENS